MAANPTIPRARRDRRLYTWFAIFMPLIVLIGFGRTYYLKGLLNGPPLPSLLVHFHGAVMTSWVLLFMRPIWLVSSRRTKIHQRLGIIGGVLAALVVIVGIATGIASAARNFTSEPASLQFLVVPLGDALIFGVLVGLALYYRRRPEIHKRLMLIAAVSLLTPAIARIPLSFIANGGPVAFFGLTDLCLVMCVAIDTFRNRKLHPAFLWGTLAAILFQPMRILLAGTQVWLHFAAWLVGFSR